MKHKSMILLSVLAVVLTLTAFVTGRVSAATGCFPDTNAHWAETFICWLKDNGITSGYPDGTYKPENYVTRAEMSVFLNKVASLNRGTGWQFDSPHEVAVNSSIFFSVAIHAPAQGALLVNGSLSLFCKTSLLSSCLASNGNTYINVDGTRYNRQYYSIDGGDSTVNGAAWNSSNTAYIPVAAGVHTVAIEVVNSSSSAGSTGVWSGGITVLFVAVGGDGTTPIPVAPEVSPASEGGQGQ